MNRFILTLAILISSAGIYAAEWGMSTKPLEIPQGAAPNVMIIMDDSGSMDWEVMTGNFETDGRFVYNQPFDNSDVLSSGPIEQQAGCPVGSVYYYGVEFNSNVTDDELGDCRLAAKDAWRFRNSDFNHLYYDPNRIYTPWPGLSEYKNLNYPDGVPYSELAAEFTASEASAAGFVLIGFDDPANPLEWLDLTRHSTSWDEVTPSGAHTNLEIDGFSYYTWEDSNNNGLFDNWVDDGDSLFEDGEGDNVQKFTVNSLSVENQKNFQNWFNFYRSREFSVKASLHFVLENMITSRVGYATLNSNTTTRDYDLEVETLNPNAEAVGSPKYNLYRQIDRTLPQGGTPLRTTLRDVGEYFSCSSTTDGSGNVMNKLGAAACPYLSIEEGATCQQNYALLFSDGFWNGSSPNVGDRDAGTGKYKGGAFADSAGEPSKSWSNTLADVAMYYYETDLRPDLDDEVMVTNIDLAREPDLDGITQMQQHMKTYTVAFGLELEGFSPDIFGKEVNETAVDWPDPTASKENKIKDMMHAAFNGRGEFYATRDDQVLTDNLADSFLKIFAEQSGAAGVSFNSQELKTGTYIFRAFYNPTTFDGDLVAITFDNSGKPLVDSPVWSASEQLDQVVAAGTRLIVSYDPDAKQGILFDYDAGLTATQQSWFEADEPTNRGVNYGDADAVWGDERIDFLWGDTSLEGARFDKGELRDRDGLLGDFANSTPRYVGIPQGIKRDFEPYPTAIGTLYSEFKNKYLHRADLVYAGANDGMLHGFDATNGKEIFAFVPNKTMDDLYEFTLPSYIHEMSVDGSPGINDVFMKDGGIEQWKTVLMGGYRAGGKGYYALDITDPGTFNQSQMTDNVMWEFSDADDDRLGLTFSTPNIVMSNAKYASGNHRWISLFGNGYNQSNIKGESSLFALFIDGGLDGDWNKVSQASNASNDDFIVMETGEGFITDGVDTYPNGLGTPRAIDIDSNGTVDIVYAGDLAGNLYRFDLSDEDPALWKMEQLLYTARYEVDSVTFTRQPITVQPIVTHNDSGSGYLVVVSTGSWMTLDDITSTDVQSLYGIWDNLSASYPMVSSELIEQEFTNVASQLHGFTYRTLSNNLVAYKDSGKIGNRVMGWVINFDLCAAGNVGCALVDAEYPGERGIRNLLIKEGVLFGVSILPSSNKACSDAPGGYLFSINSNSGGVVPEKPAFDLNDDGSFDENDFYDTDGDGVADDNEIPSAIRIDDGLPSDIAIIDGGGSDGSQVCYQTSTGELVCAGANVDSSYPQGKLSWKELAD